jgi:hypothetical protein
VTSNGLELCVNCAEEHRERHNTHEQKGSEEDRSRGSHLIRYRTREGWPGGSHHVEDGHEETEPNGPVLGRQHTSRHRPSKFPLRGPFALPGLRHRALLLFEECCEGMGDRDPSGGESPPRDGIIDFLIDLLGQPYVRFPKALLLAGLSKALDAVAAQRIWHLTPI